MFRADPALAGKKMRCPKCGGTLSVPQTVQTDPKPAAGGEPPEAASQEREAGEEPVPSRVPCPACAELILRDAAKCRFCGHITKPEKLREKRALNIPALAGLALAIFAWPVVGACFFFWVKQLIQSMMVGMAISAVAIGCGIWGVVLFLRRKPQGNGELTLSLAGAILGAFGLSSFVLYAALAKKASDAVPESMSVVKQMLGTEKPTMVPMQCADCGHQFEVTQADLLAKQSADMSGLIAGVEDINKLLDDVEKTGPRGVVCPECKKPRAFPMQVCSNCGKKFLPGFYKKGKHAALKIRCPDCGTEIRIAPAQLLRGRSALAPNDSPTQRSK